MDSGLGSDEDGRSKCSRTKEQKQRLNQQLMSGSHTPVSSTATNGTPHGVNGACFIDASSLQDDDEIQQQQDQFRKLEERRQGALIFQTSIPQYSTILQPPTEDASDDQQDPDTPFNSIVHIPTASDEDEVIRRPALGFYVDLADIDVPNESPNSSNNEGESTKTKNMFSLVIDFEAPKKEKPTRLGRVRRKSIGNGGGSSECGSDGSSSLGWLGGNGKGESNESGTGSGEVIVGVGRDVEVESKDTEEIVQIGNGGAHDDGLGKQQEALGEEEEETATAKQVKFVRLSDLEQPFFSPVSTVTTEDSSSHTGNSHRMSRSIPESSWLESPLSLMSRSTGGYYRVGATRVGAFTAGDKGVACRDVVRDRKRIGSAATREGGDGNAEAGNGGNNSLSDSTGSKTGVSQKRLGTDLLRMFLEEVDTDVVLHIGNRSIKAHRCILISRCQYFAGTLRQRTLTLDGFSYEAVHFALCHIYSGAAHVPLAISLVELASLSDLLALEGLKEVVAHELRSRHCHHFHAPCAAGCITGVLEVLPLAASYALDGLYHRCLRWIHQHYVHVWPSRAFSRLPSDFQQRCLQQHIIHLSADTVLGTLLGASQILEALPSSSSSIHKSSGSSSSSHWASAIRDIVHKLQDECAIWIKGQFEAVLGYIPLVAGEMDKFEEPLLAVIDLLTLDQTCRSYGRCLAMLAHSNVSATCAIKDFHQTFVAPSIPPPHIRLLLKIRNRLEMSLVVRMDRLLRSVTWTKLDPTLRGRIKTLFDTYKIDDNLTIGQGRTYHLPHQRHPGTPSTANIVYSSSSESSSRNSSPATSQIHTSPSLRRSLLLAAKAPQQQQQQAAQTQTQAPVVPPSPAATRRSTLTQPTASSAAKSAKDIQAVKPQQHHGKTPGNTISKSYHHYTTKSQTTTQTQVSTQVSNHQIMHTKSTGSIISTTKPRGESPSLAKRQIPVRKVNSTTQANQQQGRVTVENSPKALRKTASGSSLGSRKWDGTAAGSCSTGVVSKKQSPVNSGGVIGDRQGGAGNKRQSPVMARYLLPRKRDQMDTDTLITTTNPLTNKTTSSTSPMSSPRMRTKSAETAKAQTAAKPLKHPQGSVSNTHSPVKTMMMSHSPVKLKQQEKNSVKHGQVDNVQVMNGSPKSGSPGKGKGKGKRGKAEHNIVGDLLRKGGDKKQVLMNGGGEQKLHEMRKDKKQQNKECEDKMKRKPPVRPTGIPNTGHSRSDSPVNFDMTETIVVNSKPITRPANFDTSFSAAWDDSNPAGPISLKSLVDVAAGTTTGTSLLTRSGTFLKDEPSVWGTLE